MYANTRGFTWHRTYVQYKRIKGRTYDKKVSGCTLHSVSRQQPGNSKKRIYITDFS